MDQRFPLKKFVRERGLYEPPPKLEEVIDLTTEDKKMDGEEVSEFYRRLVTTPTPSADHASIAGGDRQEVEEEADEQARTFFCDTCQETILEVRIVITKTFSCHKYYYLYY